VHFVFREPQNETKFVDKTRWTVDVTHGACAQDVEGVLQRSTSVPFSNFCQLYAVKRPLFSSHIWFFA